MDYVNSPATIACPKCGAAEGAQCKAPSGRRADAPHRERIATSQNETRRTAEAALTAPGGASPRDVRESSVCIIISASKFSTRRTVRKGDVKVDSTVSGEVDDIDQDVVTVAKSLLDSPELRAIAGHDHYTKRWVRMNSVPSPLLRAGAFLVSVDALAEVYEYLEARKIERVELIAAFAAAYPGLVKAARESLGPLFDATEYPAAAAITSQFDLEWQVVEMGTPDNKLRAISRALFEKERDKAEKVWSNAVGQINAMLAEGMAKVVEHLSEKLGGGDEKPKRLRESAVARVMEFLDTFDKRNLTRNADLAGLVAQGRMLLSGVSAKDLKDDDKLRARVSKGFAEINAGLSKMMEDRPARAITLADEEVV